MVGRQSARHVNVILTFDMVSSWTRPGIMLLEQTILSAVYLFSVLDWHESLERVWDCLRLRASIQKAPVKIKIGKQSRYFYQKDLSVMPKMVMEAATTEDLSEKTQMLDILFTCRTIAFLFVIYVTAEFC